MTMFPIQIAIWGYVVYRITHFQTHLFKMGDFPLPRPTQAEPQVRMARETEQMRFSDKVFRTQQALRWVWKHPRWDLEKSLLGTLRGKTLMGTCFSRICRTFDQELKQECTCCVAIRQIS